MTISISNHKLLNEVYKLDHETLKGREHSLKNMIQISILRGTFGVKNNETDDKSYKEFKDYKRYQVITDQELINKFYEYINLHRNLPDNKIDNIMTIKYFIEIVKFFNVDLSNELNNIARNENIELY